MANSNSTRVTVLDFPESPERSEVATAFRDFLTRTCAAQVVRQADETNGFDADLWEAFVRLGGINASLPEPAGGGGTVHDARLIGAECGRRVAPIPYADAVSAVRLLSRIGHDAASLDVPCLVLEERPTGQTVLSGSGAAAQWVVLLGREDAVGYRLPPESVHHAKNLGALPMAHIELRQAREIFRVPVTRAIREAWLCERRVLAASTLVGGGTQAITMALAHITQRYQFGRPIGSFQVLQHRLADRATQLTAAHLLTISACDALEANAADGRHRTALALASAAQAAELAAKEALQMFGGYGYTLEYDIHLYLRYIKGNAILARDHLVELDAIAPRLPDLEARES
jgi:alkylation response protein AidB-like acyl-CoA dehydrogenase